MPLQAAPAIRAPFPLHLWFDRLFFLAAGGIAWLGWQGREALWITPEEGLGYLLGVAGGAAMLLLLLYPLRKRWRREGLGSVRGWFAAHIYLGVMGPLLILYHAGFRLGATNSNVALFCMLAVAASGFVGRYLYVKVHAGFEAGRVTLQRLREELQAGREELGPFLQALPQLDERLQRFEREASEPAPGMFQAFLRLNRLGLATRLTALGARRALAALPDAALRRRGRRLLASHLQEVRRTAEFALFDRLFAWWHLLHLPLFLMMVVTALVHVVAVHWY